MSTPKNLATAGTHLVKTGAGLLDALIVNGGTMGAITIYDSLTASGTVLATISDPKAGMVFPYVCVFSTGLTIVLAAATDVTLVYI